jgi:rhamnulokinase
MNMNGKKSVLAVDLGAESGRVMAVHYDGQNIDLEELHRFPNGPVNIHGTLYWDFFRLWSEMQAGIELGRTCQPASIGVDTWGVDFALLDKQGALISNPVHYRDERTEGMLKVAFSHVPREEIFGHTGIQIMRINTLYQLLSMVEADSPLLEIADTFLTCPDLINYWLTGEKVSEFSIATTTQMLNTMKGAWSTDLLEKLSIPTQFLPPIVQPGTRLGDYRGVPTIAPACHDTGSAVAAVPAASHGRHAYISSGTWSLVGLELPEPLINEDVMKANITNEGGVYGTIRFLSNVNGLWLVQQSRAAWQREGREYDYGTLVALAEEAPALRSFIDPNDPAFLAPGNHPALVRKMCQNTGQQIPDSEGAVIRCVLESLALEYRWVLERLISLTGQSVDVIHVVGGGARNHLLCQMTADACGREVVAGPVEATVLGNALVQLISLGDIADLVEARQIVSELDELQRFSPKETDAWDQAYERYLSLK